MTHAPTPLLLMFTASRERSDGARLGASLGVLTYHEGPGMPATAHWARLMQDAFEAWGIPEVSLHSVSSQTHATPFFLLGGLDGHLASVLGVERTDPASLFQLRERLHEAVVQAGHASEPIGGLKALPFFARDRWVEEMELGWKKGAWAEPWAQMLAQRMATVLTDDLGHAETVRPLPPRARL